MKTYIWILTILLKHKAPLGLIFLGLWILMTPFKSTTLKQLTENGKNCLIKKLVACHLI